MATPQRLANVTLATGDIVDVTIDGESITDVSPAGTDRGGAPTTTDLTGYVLLPAPVEPHAHLDKAFLADVIPNPTGDLIGAIDAMTAHRHLIDVPDTVERAERAARLMAANGFAAIRTHVDTTIENGLTSVHALVEVRRRLADLVDIEIVALVGAPTATPDQVALLHDALDAGADLVGGGPYRDDDIDATTDLLLQIATDHGVPVDLHTDETLDPAANGLEILARRVLAGFDLGATASHCVSLGQQSPGTQRATAELVAAAAITVVALPQTNLFLQGRGHHAMPRGLTALEALRAAGATVAAGADNLQDPFNPCGRGDALDTAGLMVLAGHAGIDEAWHSVSRHSATALRRASGIAPGQPADLLAVRARNLREAIAFAPADRYSWHAGRRREPT